MKHIYYLRYASIILWAALAMLFVAEFIVLNSSAFILYSFVAFIAIGILLAIFEKQQINTFAIAIVFVVSASIAYAETTSRLVIYSLLAFLLATIFAFVRFRKYALYFLLAFALLLFFHKGPVVNVAIIGYYLLTSLFIALVANTLSDTNKLRIGKKVHLLIQRNMKRIYLIATIFALLLLVSPVWPVYTHANLSVMPYADMRINSNNAFISNSILIELNLSYYSNFINQNFSNIRFAYGDREVSALALPPKNNNYDRYFLLEPNTQIENNLTLYFLPNSSGFGRYLKPNNTVSSLHAFTVSLQGPHNVRDYIHVNTTYYAPARFSKSIEFNETGYLPFQFMPTICNSGYNQSTTIDIRSNNTSSFFVFLNDTSSSKAVLADATPTYAYYVNRFANYSSVRVLNSTRGKLNLSYNQLCIYLAVVPEKNTQLNIGLNSSYYASKLFTETIIEPVIPRAYISYGFVTEGVGYLALKYENETVGTPLR